MPALDDTHPDAERVRLRLLREAGTARRLALTFGLTQQALDLSAEALRRRHPDLPERERRLRAVALRYGEALACDLRAYLDARR
ncbi:MAG TPA: hypothetical protein VK002_07300 [Rubricoccaceae bacterium]|nr:hypothetical protein [Rubricoccaceae bacterium]